MKVLVEKNENFCGSHSLENDGPLAQLVMLDYCQMCNPTRSGFVGLEDGRAIGEAVVMERPDLDPRSYELTLRAGLKRNLPEDFDDRALLKRTAQTMAAELLDICDAYAPGSVVVRTFGEYDIFYHRDAG